MDPRIKQILEYAILAPSGDNCQPWKFTVNDLKVDLYNSPLKDTSLYNLQQRASLIAHGAALENIAIAAPTVGLKADIQFFPKPEDNTHIASITFSECAKTEHPLFPAIPKRHTNRENYLPVKISDTQKEQWLTLPQNNGQKVWIGTETEEINKLASLLAYNDRLVFEVPDLHRFLFEQIRWSDNHARETGDGLDIKTLGLNKIDQFAFKFLKNWGLVALLKHVGFTKIIELKGKQLLKTSSAIAVLVIPDTKEPDYVQGGQLWQRLLLQLSSQGLTAQPVAGLAVLLQSAYEGKLEDKISSAQKDRLINIRQELLQMTGTNENAVILAMFRIGQGKQVTRALRRPLETFLKTEN